MLLAQENIHSTFTKLNRQLSKLATKPAPENIHRFRTSSRRVEVLLGDVARKCNRNDKKLLKLLGRLRKKAGRVRDLDTQAAALRSLRMPQEPVRKSQLMRVLAEERSKREKKLLKAVNKKAAAELRRQLKRASNGIDIPKNSDPVALAKQKITALPLDASAVSEKTLHRFRIAGKRARYIAELAAKDPEAIRLIEQLRHMQDVIGDWHDWIQLTERAENLFEGMHDSALLAALRNVTRAKFRQAVSALVETRAALGEKRPIAIRGMAAQPGRQGSAAAAAVA